MKPQEEKNVFSKQNQTRAHARWWIMMMKKLLKRERFHATSYLLSRNIFITRACSIPHIFFFRYIKMFALCLMRTIKIKEKFRIKVFPITHSMNKKIYFFMMEDLPLNSFIMMIIIENREWDGWMEEFHKRDATWMGEQEGFIKCVETRNERRLENYENIVDYYSINTPPSSPTVSS